MFGMGWQEILLILVVAVLVIGPDQLPQVARTLGKLIAQFRRVSNDLRDTVNREFQENESLKEFKEFQNSIDNEVRGIGYTAKEYVDREVAKGEAELAQLDEDVRANGGDPGTLTDPDDGATPDWSHTVGDFPLDENAPTDAADPAEATAAVEDEAAPPSGAASDDEAREARPADATADAESGDDESDSEDAAERSSTRRETA